MKTEENIRKELRNYYNLSHKYVQNMQRHDYEYFETYLDLLRKFAPFVIHSSSKLLELGCGHGASTYFIAKQFSEYYCIGLDISEPGITHAKSTFSSKNLLYQVSDCLELPFSDGTFSIVTSFDCIEHLPNPEVALREMIRILRPSGIILIKAPHHRNPIIPVIDILTFKHRYPFTQTWVHNLPRFIELSSSFLKTIFSQQVYFNMRSPDLTDDKAVGNDADAVYEVSILDLIKFFRKNRLSILNMAAPRNNSVLSKVYTYLFPYFASIGIVVQKKIN